MNKPVALKWLSVNILWREAAFSVLSAEEDSVVAEKGSVIPQRMVFPSRLLYTAWTQEPSGAGQHLTAAHVRIDVLHKKAHPCFLS